MEIGILLRGSDTEKRAFSEHTKTVVLSRHGAGVVSHRKLAPETKITLYRVDTNEQIEARVVGLVGSQSDSYTYGLAFLETAANFWGIDFPPESESEQESPSGLFECSGCKGRERIVLNDMESDIYAVHQALARSCKRCESPTVWKRAGNVDNKSVLIAPPTNFL